MCAKSYKLFERIEAANGGGRNRVKAKDAGDVWRLIATTDAGEIRETFRQCEEHSTLGEACRKGRSYFEMLFAGRGRGVDLAVQDLADEIDEDTVRSSVSNWIACFIA
jgi:hypothetical protein